jgi:hypothetical protein
LKKKEDIFSLKFELILKDNSLFGSIGYRAGSRERWLECRGRMCGEQGANRIEQRMEEIFYYI